MSQPKKEVVMGMHLTTADQLVSEKTFVPGSVLGSFLLAAVFVVILTVGSTV